MGHALILAREKCDTWKGLDMVPVEVKVKIYTINRVLAEEKVEAKGQRLERGSYSRGAC